MDIDRTIINGTSWYHACSCPNLLIDEYNIDRFKELNNKMYVHGTSKDRYEFRKQTFELIIKEYPSLLIENYQSADVQMRY